MKTTLSTLPHTQCLVDGATCVEMRVDLNPAAAMLPQVETYWGQVGDPREYDRIVLPGQSHAAVAFMAMAAHARGSLSLEIGLVPFRATVPSGWLNIATLRHDDVRERRFAALSEPREFLEGYVMVDCAPRAMTTDQLEQLAKLLGCDPGQIKVAKCDPGQVKVEDLGGAEGERIQALIFSALQQAGVSLASLQQAQQRLLVNPAPLGTVAAYMAAVFQGALEVWPRHIRLAPAGNNVFMVAEIMDIQSTRQWVDAWVAQQNAAEAPIAVPRDLFNKVYGILHEIRRVSLETPGVFDTHFEGCGMKIAKLADALESLGKGKSS